MGWIFPDNTKIQPGSVFFVSTKYSSKPLISYNFFVQTPMYTHYQHLSKFWTIYWCFLEHFLDIHCNQNTSFSLTCKYDRPIFLPFGITECKNGFIFCLSFSPEYLILNGINWTEHWEGKERYCTERKTVEWCRKVTVLCQKVNYSRLLQNTPGTKNL